METKAHPSGLQDALEFPLVEALYGRRARRFSLGALLPDGPLAFTSQHDPLPLTELEQMLVLTAAAGNTGWHYMIMRHARYAPHLSNYSGAAGGRTFPSAAGFHTSEVFFTDDEGVPLRDPRGPRAGRADDRRAYGPRRHPASPSRPDTQAIRPPATHPRRRALHGGAQHLVRQPPGEHATDPGGGHSPAHDRRPLLHGPERIRALR